MDKEALMWFAGEEAGLTRFCSRSNMEWRAAFALAASFHPEGIAKGSEPPLVLMGYMTL